MTKSSVQTADRIGLGLWPGDDPLLGRPRHAHLERLLWHAAGCEVPWIDIVHDCEDGALEDEVGGWLSALPADSRPAVFTKGGIVNESGPGRCVSALHPSVLRAHVDASLRSLRVGVIDAFFLHYPDETGLPVEDSWAVLAELAAEGKIARAGLCAFGLDALSRCEDIRHVDLFMCHVDPLDLGSSLRLLEWCEDHGTDVVAWVPGDPSRVFDPSYAGPLAGTPYTRSSSRLQRLLAASVASEMQALVAVHDVARATGMSPEAVVSSWLLAQPGVTKVAVGAENGAQLDRWLANGHAPLTPEAVAQISAAGAETVLGV